MFSAASASLSFLPAAWRCAVLDDSEGPRSLLIESHPSCSSSSPSTKAYDPDLDDYDVRTAPVLPPVSTELEDDWKQRQIRALEGRIAKGGDVVVLSHYCKVVSELKASCMQKRKKYCHMRNSSSSSTCTVSTVFPDDAADLDISDAEDEEEDLDAEVAIPQEESTGVMVQTSAAVTRTTLESKRQTEGLKVLERGEQPEALPAANWGEELFPARHRLTYAMVSKAFFLAVLEEPYAEGTAGWLGL
jgi:hypothetical protein